MTERTATADPTPRLTLGAAESLARRLYGLEARAARLPSERDQNFALDAGGRRYVLKIANAAEDQAVLELQNAVFEHVAVCAPALAVPRLVRTTAGEALATAPGDGGVVHFVRLLTWLEGDLYAEVAPHDARLLGSLGEVLGELDAALLRFRHPAMQRTLHWDLRHADQAFVHAPLLTPAQRALVDDIVRDWHEIRWSTLRHSVIHGDANDYNVLVRAGRVVGLLDYGDMVHSALACELAIGLAYAMLGTADPCDAACHVVAGYTARLPLTAPETAALAPLTLTRLAMSVCHAAHNARAKRDDPYQQVTAAPAWELLGRLAALPPGQFASTLAAAARAH